MLATNQLSKKKKKIMLATNLAILPSIVLFIVENIYAFLLFSDDSAANHSLFLCVDKFAEEENRCHCSKALRTKIEETK
jgi:hypothetical protein